MKTKLTNTWLTLLVAVAMLTITMPALASHNSFGAPNTHIVEPDEFDADTGLLSPDIPEDSSPHHLEFHKNLDEFGLPARPAPADQSGELYKKADDGCEGPDAFEDAEGDLQVDLYETALENREACYVGYLDQVAEYMFATAPLLVTECPCDLLYWANPSGEDEYCRAEEEGDPDEWTGEEEADRVLTRADRQVNDGLIHDVLGTNGRCDDAQDNSYLTGNLLVDTSLMETGRQTVGETLGNDMGSGSASTMVPGTTYLFVFGQPHPDVTPDDLKDAGQAPGEGSPGVNENHLRFEAGSGPFGANPAELGNPLHDLSGACGLENGGDDTRRTAECLLLTPEDIKAYDHWTLDEDTPDPEQPRVCAYHPQYSYAVATDTDGSINRDQGVCGNTGQQYDEFMNDVTAGGHDVTANVMDDEGEGSPPTWFTNLPGWGWGVIYTLQGADDQWLPYATAYQDDAEEYENDELSRNGFIHYTAVNPHVPTREGDLACVIPNIKADGDDSIAPGDPGVYGTYMADAIDADVYVNPFYGQLDEVNDATHSDVRTVIEEIEAAQDLATDTTDGLLSAAAGANTGNEEVDGVIAGLDEIQDRAEFSESSHTPAGTEPGPQNVHGFPAAFSAGLACDHPSGDLTFNEPHVLLTVTTNGDVDETFTVTLADHPDTEQGAEPEPLGNDVVQVFNADGDTPFTNFENIGSHDIKLVFNADAVDELGDTASVNVTPGDLDFSADTDGFEDSNLDVSQGDTVIADGIDSELGVGEIAVAEGLIEIDAVSGAVGLWAGVNFQASVTQESGENVKDPTLLDGNLPATESDTDEGYWQPDVYSFNGDAHAFVDITQSDSFDGCPGANVGAGDDLCPWESLWDAYNESDESRCQNRAEKSCGQILRDNGYNVNDTEASVDPGVGLYSVLELTGPAIVSTDLTSQNDTVQVGMAGVDAKSCIVGTSFGFDTYLPFHLGLGDLTEEDEGDRADAILSELCPADADDTVFFGDAFDVQSGVERGGFSSSLEWVKLTPTPDDSQGLLGDSSDDALCVSGVWSISEDVEFAGDTVGQNNIHLEGGTVHTFSHSQSLTTGTDTPEDNVFKGLCAQ